MFLFFIRVGRLNINLRREMLLLFNFSGVTCAEELSRLVDETDEVYLISQSRILKIVTNVQAISRTTETFDLVPTDLEQYRRKSNFHVLQGTIVGIDTIAKYLITEGRTRYPYDKLCLATGGRPNVLFDHPNVIGIRDIESVDVRIQKYKQGHGKVEKHYR
jgi:NADH dehydrogenase FAD-containing subunit